MELGLRDLWRGRLRFGLLGGALALLVFLVLFLSTLSSTLVGFLIGAVANNSAQVLVYDAGARRNLQASRLPPGTVERVRSLPGVRAAGPVGNSSLTVDVGKGLTELSLFGWQPGLPGGPSKVVGGVVPGPGEVLVDQADEASGFRIGATISINSTGRRLRVVGYTTDSRFNVGPTAYTPIATYREIVRAANPKAPYVPDNLVAVDADPGRSPEQVAGTIDASEPGLEALPRSVADSSVPGAGAVSQSFDLIIGITFAIVVVVIGFFFLILTVQKMRVFTALRALGATTGYLARSLFAQVVVVVLLGAAVGVGLLGLAVATSSAAFPLRLDVRLAGVTTLAVLGCSVLASLASLRRIARIDPVDAAGVR